MRPSSSSLVNLRFLLQWPPLGGTRTGPWGLAGQPAVLYTRQGGVEHPTCLIECSNTISAQAIG